MTENSYSAPRADLHKVQDTAVTWEMTAAIRSAGKWARLISIVVLLVLIVTALLGVGAIAAVIFAGAPVLYLLGLLGILITDWLLWLVFSAMHRYAKTAKGLEDSAAQEEDIAQCFSYSTRVLKIQALIFIITILFGIATAIILPAFIHLSNIH